MALSISSCLLRGIGALGEKFGQSSGELASRALVLLARISDLESPSRAVIHLNALGRAAVTGKEFPGGSGGVLGSWQQCLSGRGMVRRMLHGYGTGWLSLRGLVGRVVCCGGGLRDRIMVDRSL